eukprot:GHVQ01016695.1.p1 GENE.GHVQ01016695.1~~GHVQ01016695.1.p1  ORF type:complete len:541 (-),score=23.45 GHVQ01016695.1:565-2187(-)
MPRMWTVKVNIAWQCLCHLSLLVFTVSCAVAVVQQSAHVASSPTGSQLSTGIRPGFPQEPSSPSSVRSKWTSPCSIRGHETADVCIVGGGLTGLTTAYYLKKQGDCRVVLLESENRAGGCIRTVKMKCADPRYGYLCEIGANSFQSTTIMKELVAELGLQDMLLSAPRDLKRYIFFRNELHALPHHLRSFLASRLLSAGAKLRLFGGILGMSSHDMTAPENDDSIGHVLSQLVGSEAVDRLVVPFVSGIYAGDVSRLSFKSCFPQLHDLLRQRRPLLLSMISRKESGKPEKPTLSSLKGGLSVLVERLHSLTDATPATSEMYNFGASTNSSSGNYNCLPTVRLGWMADKIWKESNDNGGFWYCETVNGTGERRVIRSRFLVLTCHVEATRTLLKSVPNSGASVKQIQQLLSRIPYANVGLVCSAYPRKDIRIESLEGFGHLIPRIVGLKSLGSIWSSQLFSENRCPPDQVLFTSFIGGTAPFDVSRDSQWNGGRQSYDVCNVPREEVIRSVHEDLQRIVLRKAVVQCCAQRCGDSASHST